MTIDSGLGVRASLGFTDTVLSALETRAGLQAPGQAPAAPSGGLGLVGEELDTVGGNHCLLHPSPLKLFVCCISVFDIE